MEKLTDRQKLVCEIAAKIYVTTLADGYAHLKENDKGFSTTEMIHDAVMEADELVSWVCNNGV